MIKSEKKILEHIKSANGLTNPLIAANQTGYAIVTSRRIFKQFLNTNVIFAEMSDCATFYYVKKI